MSWRWYCSLFKPPNQEKWQRWQQVKAKGRKAFILRVGVMQFGGMMFVWMTALYLIRKPSVPRQTIDYVVEIAINLLMWPIAGYFFGRCMWEFYETYLVESGHHSPPSATLSD